MRRALVVLVAAVLLGLLPPAPAVAADREVLRAVVAGDFIDVDSRHDRLWRQWPKDRVTIALGDLVHKNAPDFLWRQQWMPRWGSLPTCRVWSVIGNHEWGWSKRSWSPPAYGSTYLRYRGAFHRDCPAAQRDTYQWVKRRPGWLLVGLNTETCTQATRFLARAVDRWPRRDVAVFTHRPMRLPPGSNAPPLTCPSLVRLVDRKADVVLSGHSHRFWRSGKHHVVGTVDDGLGWGTLSLYRSGRWDVAFVRR